MKVRIKRNVYLQLSPGTVLDLPEAEAKALCRSSAQDFEAVADDAQPKRKVETATQPSGKAR